MSTITERRRALRLEARERQAETLPKLRGAVKEARVHRRSRLKEIRGRCKTRMMGNRERATAARLKLRERIAATKEKAREVCKLSKATATEKELDAIDRALTRLIEEREAIGELRRQASLLSDPRGRAGGLRAAELREESDDEVRRDIGGDSTLLAVFDKIRGKIKATKHRSRTEAFFEHLHNHPELVDEVLSAQQVQWDRDADRLMGSLRKVAPLANIDEYVAQLDEADRLLVQHPVSMADVPF